jgi:hypothetical protein
MYILFESWPTKVAKGVDIQPVEIQVVSIYD